MGNPEPDLTVFRDANKNKIPWSERLKLIHKQFPHAKTLDWKRVFDQDPTIMGRIISDILKIDQAVPGRPGKRAAIDQDIAVARFRQILGDDYTTLPFQEAFRSLVANQSMRVVARKIGVSHSYVQRLVNGEAQPDAYVMEEIAKAFRKTPDYFAEYRVAFILGVLSGYLEGAPDATVPLFRRVRGVKNR